MPRVRISSVISWKSRRNSLIGGVLGLAALLWAVPAWANQLRILTWANYLSPQVVARFQQETGISVTVDTVTSYTAMIAPLLAGNQVYDVVFPADFQVTELVAQGLLERVGVDRLANFWNVDDVWRARAFDPRNEYTIPHVWGTTAFAVDTAVYGGNMDSLRLVFQPPPSLAGRMAVVDSGFDMVQLALVWLKLPRCSTQADNIDKVRDLLLPILRRVAVVGSDRIVQDMIDGRYALAVMWNGDALMARKRRPSLRYANPVEGSLVWSDVIAVAKGAPNRAGGQAFLSFMMRPEIAAQQSNFNGYANMIRGAEAFMDPGLLNAPEIITPPSSALDFFTHCGNGAETQQEAIWGALLREAGK
ncbi:ABC transporter substrate-binding protein [Magnetospirillum gryphiswaldense]|uniref:ABC transporter substrate-binding protein n=1 Tax=Magnetospirillum gryphiswaldense TaxID=55518 RepID=UPI000321EDA9|nr:extracellular solute-binding protein [Magnetospirillum gryphiswaldense]AVM74573.1 Spermidine/putrescine-binding periplasmic protein precursor [Magnetospirillum gryphiswaldense MSR-1]AVM78476.1 Spermidine/putrescine-binding periplasmic protein precursor [Magnetospirillum gryphiswaldense]